MVSGQMLLGWAQHQRHRGSKSQQGRLQEAMAFSRAITLGLPVLPVPQRSDCAGRATATMGFYHDREYAEIMSDLSSIETDRTQFDLVALT